MGQGERIRPLNFLQRAQEILGLGFLFGTNRLDQGEGDPGGDTGEKTEQEPQPIITGSIKGIADQDWPQSATQGPRKNRTGKN